MPFLDWHIMIINSASSTYQSRKNEWPGFLGMGIMCIWQIRLIGKHYMQFYIMKKRLLLYLVFSADGIVTLCIFKSSIGYRLWCCYGVIRCRK